MLVLHEMFETGPERAREPKRRSLPKLPALSPERVKSVRRGSGFLVLSPNLPKACGVEPPDPACV